MFQVPPNYANADMFGQQLPPAAYGATPYGYEAPGLGYSDRKPPNQQQDGWRPLLRFSRRRMNFVPIFGCILIPWLVFVFEVLVTSYELHYKQPLIYSVITACTAIVVLIICGFAASSRIKRFSNPEREPAWTVFFALAIFLAWIVGFIVGNNNYNRYMAPYYDIKNLNTYMNVYPTILRGQQLMDAGIVQFAHGTRLDISKSMGFKNSITYCVAPIILGNESLATYDFWSVGKGCCSTNHADFHCKGYNNPQSTGGLRLMDDDSRANYRLAVQQAEASYNIKAAHPLFFEWVENPMDTVEGWRQAGWNSCLKWIMIYFAVQVFGVGAVTMIFSRLGNL